MFLKTVPNIVRSFCLLLRVPMIMNKCSPTYYIIVIALENFYGTQSPQRSVEKMGQSLAVISVRIHENPSKCDVQLFSQNTKLSISPQECKIFVTKYIFSKSTLLKLQNPVFGFFIRPMVHFLKELNLEVKFSGIE